MWPVPVPASWRPSKTGRFGAARPKDGRRHTAVDLPAELGQVVVAPADGTVTGITGWDGEGKAVYLKTAVGTWILAPVAPLVDVGGKLAIGEPLGLVVEYPGHSKMLHLELWARGAGKNTRPTWKLGQLRPFGALDAWRFLHVFTGPA